MAFASCAVVVLPRIWVPGAWRAAGRLCGGKRGAAGRDTSPRREKLPRGGAAYPCCARRATRWLRPAGWPGSPPCLRRCPPPARISAGNRRLSPGFPRGSSSSSLPPASPTDQLPRPIPGPGGARSPRRAAARAGSGMPDAGGERREAAARSRHGSGASARRAILRRGRSREALGARLLQRQEAAVSAAGDGGSPRHVVTERRRSSLPTEGPTLSPRGARRCPGTRRGSGCSVPLLHLPPRPRAVSAPLPPHAAPQPARRRGALTEHRAPPPTLGGSPPAPPSSAFIGAPKW